MVNWIELIGQILYQFDLIVVNVTDLIEDEVYFVLSFTQVLVFVFFKFRTSYFFESFHVNLRFI